MKNFLVIVLVALGSVLYAQEETLLGKEVVSHGGFGAPVVKFTSIRDNFGVLVGGRGGWIINHSFVLGGGGYGLVNEIDGTRILNGRNMLLTFGYGGFEMEYIMHWEKIAHVSFYYLIGAGGVNQRRNWDDWNYDWDSPNTDVFFIVEPAVNLEVNMTSFFRIGLGASYRFISGINEDNLKNEDFAGPSAMLTFKFGKF